MLRLNLNSLYCLPYSYLNVSYENFGGISRHCCSDGVLYSQHLPFDNALKL